MPTMQEVRAQYPQYSDLSDDQLSDALHKKFYSDIPQDEFREKLGLKKRGFASGLGRQLEQGFTLGFGDEINAGLRSFVGGEKYDDALKDERNANEEFAKENPWITTGAQIAGSLPTFLIPGANALLGVKALQTAKTGYQAAKAGANVGLRTGAVAGYASGEGDTDAEGVFNRLGTAAVSAPVSAVLGGTLGYGAHRIGEAIGGITQARKDATGQSGVYNAVAKAFGRDEVDPAALQAAMLPSATKKVSADMAADIARLKSEGLTNKDIAARLGVSPVSVSAAIRRFDAINETPLTLVDRAKLTGPGEGQNTEWLMRAAAATPGKARTTAARTLSQRQVAQRDRLDDAVKGTIGTGEDDVIEGMQSSLKELETQAYKLAGIAEKEFDLAPVLNDWSARFAPRMKRGHAEGRFDPASSTLTSKISDAADLFYDAIDVPSAAGGNPVKGFFPIRGLSRFQEAKEELDHMIENSFKDGKATRATALLQKFKGDVMRVVANSNPAWKEANDSFTGAGREALKRGGEIALRMNSKSREAIDYFRRLEKRASDKNPVIAASGQAQIKLFREGMSRAIRERLANRQDTHDLTSELRLPGAQTIIRHVLPKKEADRLIKLVREEAATTSSFRSLQGSQTAPLTEAIDDLRGPERLVSMLDYGNPLAYLKLAGDQVAKRVSAVKNNKIMDLLTDIDPVNQIKALKDISRFSAARRQAGSKARERAAPFIGGVSTATGVWDY